MNIAIPTSCVGRVGRAGLASTAAVALAFAGCGSGAATSQLSSHLRATSRIAYYHPAIGAGPTVITRDDGTVLDERRYEPFGAAIGAIDYALDPHNSLNKESDVHTGWSDHGARWLAPETARWLTPDPPVKAPDPKFMTEPWGLHPYQYVKQNPILFWDPDGRDDAPIFTLNCGDRCTVGSDGLIYMPGHAPAHEPSAAHEVQAVAETVVSPVLTITAGKWGLVTTVFEEAEVLAKPLDKASSGLSFFLALSHGIQYQYAETYEEQNEHAGGFFLGAASLYLPVGVAIAILSLFDPDINKHVGTPIDVNEMLGEAAHLSRMEAARKYAPTLPAASDWHDAEWERLNTPSHGEEQR
jgi:RHS repeat-associated protein